MSGCMVNDTSDCMHITSIACFVFPVFWGGHVFNILYYCGHVYYFLHSIFCISYFRFLCFVHICGISCIFVCLNSHDV